MGLGYVVLAVALTALALCSSLQTGLGFYVCGQALLALVLVLWLALLHEAGHETLFATRWLHRPVAHIAGFFALLPLASWRPVHNLHHKWTGWQDLDPTTRALVPRTLGRGERLLLNLCWRWWIPLFGVLYRLTFWSPARLRQSFPQRETRRSILLGVATHGAAYAALACLVGPRTLLVLVAPGLVLSLLLGEMLLLSQHTHVPQRRSGGRDVVAIPASLQGPFTRSLRLPALLSKALLHFDAHELHHRHPAVPGYRLCALSAPTGNQVSGWRWLWTARRIPGEVFFFQDRTQSGAPL